MHNILVTLVPCDAAVFTSKWNLIGVFSTLTFDTFPAAIPAFHAYLHATGISNPNPFELRLQLVRTAIDADGVAPRMLWSNHVTCQLNAAVRTGGQPGSFEMAFLVADIADGDGLKPVAVDELGNYDLEALVDGRVASRATITVLRSKGGNRK
jgi:hypothetical protein